MCLNLCYNVTKQHCYYYYQIHPHPTCQVSYFLQVSPYKLIEIKKQIKRLLGN